MKYEIEIEGLPEGYKLKEPGKVKHFDCRDLIVFKMEKIQPRRIVLEETQERNIQYPSGIYSSQCFTEIVLHNKHKIWREVKENEGEL